MYVDKQLASEICCGRHNHLHRAVATSDECGRVMLKRLLKASAPVEQQDKNGETALHVASRLRNTEGAYSLLQARLNMDALLSQEWTPLHLSCCYGHAETTRLLLDFRADATKPGPFRWTALRHAFQNEHEECMEALIQYSAADMISSQGFNEIKQQWGIYTFSK